MFCKCPFSNLKIIYEEKTQEISTVKEFGYVDSNYCITKFGELSL